MKPLLAVLVLLTSPALAQQPLCSSRADITAQLSEKYAEVPVSMGISSTGGVMEVLSSPNGATWTIIITMPNGQSCMVTAGSDWRRRSMPTGGMDG